jgi:hypothetical protein
MTSSAASNTTTGHPERWEERWASNNTGWDQGGAHPALVSLLSSESGRDGRKRADELGVKRDGRALVPGCGMVSRSVSYCVMEFTHYEAVDLGHSGSLTAARRVSDAKGCEC